MARLLTDKPAKPVDPDADKSATVATAPDVVTRGGLPMPVAPQSRNVGPPNSPVALETDNIEVNADAVTAAVGTPARPSKQETADAQKMQPPANKPVNTSKADEQISATRENTLAVRQLVTETQTTNRLISKGHRIA